MKRYTRSARSTVIWNRHDTVTTGPGCKPDQYRTKRLVDLAMAAVRALRKTSFGFERGCEQLSAIAEWGESIARDTVPSQMGNCSSEQDEVIDVENETGCEPHAPPPVPKEIQISDCAPKEATTKGESVGGNKLLMMTQVQEAEGKRTCGYCGSLGHYSTGCDINPEMQVRKEAVPRV